MDRNKQVVRRLYQDALNGRNLGLLDELVRSDYIEHDPLPGQGEGIDGIKSRYGMLIEALDPTFTVEDVIAEGDKVVVRWMNAGTNVGDFLGIPATGRAFSIAGIDIYRLEEGKLAEHWHVVDMFAQMQQLGLLPSPQDA